MRNGITAVFLSAAFVATAGCERNPSSATSRHYGGNAPAGQLVSVRYQVDSGRERVWWLTGEGVFVNNARALQRTAVPIPGWTWAREPWSCMPDLALGPRGEALVTSNVLPVVWKIDPDTLAVTEHPLLLDADADKDVGFSGLTYSPEHDAYFAVSGAHGTLWKIDPQLTRGEKIALSMPIHNACRVAMGGRVVPQASARAVGLCVGGKQRNWTVELVIAHRVGHVRDTACTDLPWRIGQLAMNDR
jgi:hypothetical protein